MAILFGNIAAVMSSMNKKDSHFQEQMDFVQTTMRVIVLPEYIQNEVLNYLMQV